MSPQDKELGLEQSTLHDGESRQGDVPELPPAPNPSADPALTLVEADSPRTAPQQQDDIFKMTPKAALELLGTGVETLVRLTGDVPPTPPTTSPTMPNMRGMQMEKEKIIRSNSQQDLARLRRQAEAAEAGGRSSGDIKRPASSHLEVTTPSSLSAQPVDGVHLKAVPQSVAVASSSIASGTSSESQPVTVVGEDSQPINVQHNAITRRFYSKKPPPVSVKDYLTRLHRYCPMSTAVYLATSLYIHRLAVDERAISVTKLNVHRLLLAGLRIAMKALEDLSYPRTKMARVGGVTETELSRLEISFCFLTSFELVAREDALRRHCETLRQETNWHVLKPPPVMTLSVPKKAKGQPSEGQSEEEGQDIGGH